MSKRKTATIAAVLVCSLLLVGIALASAAPSIDWYVIGGGGGHADGGSFTIDGTIGQAVVGEAADTSIEICAGFWCGGAETITGKNIYLPLVVRN